MSLDRKCPDCHSLLPSDAPLGLCPRCLVEVDLPPKRDRINSSLIPRRKRYIGGYELLNGGCAGGMGIVYRARQMELNRIVALKMIRFQKEATLDERSRFRIEAMAIARLRHDHIVPIYEAGEFEGEPYFSMEFMEGGDLGRRLGAEGQIPFTIRESAELVIAIANAVHHAHEQGVLHRDLKPANILFNSNGRPYVTDFGLAKISHDFITKESGIRDENLNDLDHFTHAAGAKGTAGYASPEQASGRADVTKASDVFSLGVILFRLIAGQSPYPAKWDNWDDYLAALQTTDPVRPSRLNSAVDADLEAICLKCLVRDPALRYGTARALSDDLTRWLRMEPVTARPISSWERGRKWIRRHPVVASAAIAIVTSLLLTAGLIAERRHSQKQQAGQESTQRRLLLKNAEDHFSNRRADLALAELALALRNRPDNRAAAERILNAFAQRTFLIPCRREAEMPPDEGAISPDRKLRLLGVGTNTITVLNSETGKPQVLITNAHLRVIRDVRFSAGGQHFISAGADSNAVVWSTRNGARLLSLAHPAAVNHAEFSPDGSKILTACRDGAARLWSLSTGQPLGEPMIHDAAVLTARFGSSGQRIVSTSDDHAIRLWDAQTTAPLSEAAYAPTAALDAQFARDGRHIIARTFDDRTNSFLVTMPSPWSVAMPEEKLEAFQPTPLSKTRHVSKLRQMMLDKFGGEILSADLSPDELTFAVGFTDGTVRTSHAINGEPLYEPLFHDGKVNCVRFSPDGLRLVTSTSKNRIRIWDVQTGQPLSDAERSPSSIVGVNFIGDGNWVITSAGLKFEVPKVAEPVPSWFPDFVETCVRIPETETNAPAYTRRGGTGPNFLSVWQDAGPTNYLTRWIQRAMEDSNY